MNLAELRKALKAAIEEARKASDGLAVAGLTEERKTELNGEYEAKMKECEELRADIDRKVQLEEMEKEASRSDDPDAVPTPDDDPGKPADPTVPAEVRKVNRAYESEEYRTAAWKHVLLGEQHRNFNEAEKGAFERMEEENRAQGIATDAQGAVLLPKPVLDMLEKDMHIRFKFNDTRFRHIRTPGGEPFPYPKFDDTDNEAAARAELADPTVAPDADFSKKDFSAHAFDTGRLKISRELLTDAQRFSDFSSIEDLFVEALSERMMKIQGKLLTTGSGVNQPQGIVIGSMEGKTAASQNGIVLDDIIDMSESIPEEYMEGIECIWMMHQDTLKALKKLKDGENRPLWQMGNIQIGTPNNLYGHQLS